MKTIIALLIGMLSFAANADPRKDAEKFVDKLNAQYDSLERHSGNVLQMTQGSISDEDYKHAEKAYDQAVKFETALERVSVLASIYSVMVDKFDQKVAQRYFLIACASTQKTGSMALERINRHMAGIRSAALLDEMKAMRDDAQTLVDTLDFCKK
jgi:hypothetical protein